MELLLLFQESYLLNHQSLLHLPGVHQHYYASILKVSNNRENKLKAVWQELRNPVAFYYSQALKSICHFISCQVQFLESHAFVFKFYSYLVRKVNGCLFE